MSTQLTFPHSQIGTADDVHAMVALADNTRRVESITRAFHTINVEQVMRNLGSVGQLLQIAYAGTSGHSSNTAVIGMLSKYQNMVHKTSGACADFLNHCVGGVEKHRLAYIFADQGKNEASLCKLVETADKAHEMAVISGKLLKDATQLCELAESALLSATDDKTRVQGEKDKARAFIRQQKEQEEKLKKKEAALQEAIQKYEEDEKKAAEQSATITKVAMIAVVTLSVMIPAGNAIAGKLGATMLAEETITKISAAGIAGVTGIAANADTNKGAILDKRAELVKAQIDATADLTHTVEKLLSGDQREGKLAKSLHALSIAVKALGAIKTTFLHVQVYWGGVERHCRSLTDRAQYGDAAELGKDELLGTIRNSALSWLALARIQCFAVETIRKVTPLVDAFMGDLPTTEGEAERIIKEEAPIILDRLRQDHAALKAMGE